jgi:hypothetical protein
MNTFCIEYVGEDIPGVDKCNFVTEEVKAWTAKEARNTFLDRAGDDFDSFRITDIWQRNVRQRFAEWNGMD